MNVLTLGKPSWNLVDSSLIKTKMMTFTDPWFMEMMADMRKTMEDNTARLKNLERMLEEEITIEMLGNA